MGRRVTCPKCYREFTAAQYLIHEYSHRRDEFSRKDPIDLPTSKLLPIEVPDDSDEEMEDILGPGAQTMDYNLPPIDNPFSDNHENAGGSFLSNDPFSDDHATTSANLLHHDIPFADTSHPLPPSPPSDKDLNVSPSHSEDGSVQGSVLSQPSPLVDEDLGFEDAGLDPAFSGRPSLSEQLKERFLASYHGGGKWY